MSVLLESLKKAALEKRTRDESPGGDCLPEPAAEEQATGSETAAEVVALAVKEATPHKPVVATAAADYVARQEANRTRRSFEEMEEAAEHPVRATDPEPATAGPEPAFAPGPEAAGEAETEAHDVTAGPSDDDAPGDVPDGLPAESAEHGPVVEDFSLPHHAVDQTELPAQAHAPDESLDLDEHEEDLDLDLDATAAAELDTPATEAAAEQGPEINPAAAAEIDQAEQRRAMQRLMGRSRDVLTRSKRRGNYMHAALLVASVIAIGLYYWVLSHSDGPAMPEPLILIEQGEVEAQPAQVDLAPVDAAAVSEGDSPLPEVAEKETVITESSAAAPVVEDSGRDASPVTREPVSLVEPVRKVVLDRAETGSFSNSRVLIERRQTPRPVARKVKDAYRAYQLGDHDRASRLYREVLEEAPRQRDALLGSAAIAVQRGQYQEALRYYQRRLVDDSGDHYARAGLLALASQGATDPELQSEVKILLDDYPQQAHLHFLLGSMQAAAGAWPEAQRSFFEARSWDRDNPDYAYNLAVSLEHLRQPAQALAQYRQALDLAALTTPQFDAGVAARRVAYLEARQP